MSTTDLLDRARAAIPGYADLTEAHGRAEAARAALRDTPRPSEAALVGEIADAFLAGDDFDVAQRALEIRTVAKQRRADALHALAGAARELAVRRDAVVAERVGDGLAVLAEELRQIVDQARPAVAALDAVGAQDADGAIRADLVDEWRTLAAAGERYAALRQVHARLVGEAVSGTVSWREGGVEVPRWGGRRLSPPAAVAVFGHLADSGAALDLPADPGAALRRLVSSRSRLGVPGPDVVRTRAEAADAPPAQREAPMPVNRPARPYEPREAGILYSTDPPGDEAADEAYAPRHPDAGQRVRSGLEA